MKLTSEQSEPLPFEFFVFPGKYDAWKGRYTIARTRETDRSLRFTSISGGEFPDDELQTMEIEFDTRSEEIRRITLNKQARETDSWVYRLVGGASWDTEPRLHQVCEE